MYPYPVVGCDLDLTFFVLGFFVGNVVASIGLFVLGCIFKKLQFWYDDKEGK